MRRLSPLSKKQVSHRPIYLDNHATTPTDPRVAEVVLAYMTERFGNASSADHVFGDEAGAAVVAASQQVAALVGAEPGQVVFTSGATESANLALQGLAAMLARQADRPRRIRIGVMPVEHPAVLETCTALEHRGGAAVTYFHVDDKARLDLQDFRSKCRAGLDVVCIMAANNEVGTIYPVQEAAAIAHEYGALFFCDGSQAAGRIPLDADAWGIDLLAVSAHKLYGPKGVGGLVIGEGVRIEPILHGGSHQSRIRPGTLNAPGIAGFGEACRLRTAEMQVDETRIQRLRDTLQVQLSEGIPGMVVNGDLEHRLAGNLHVSVPVPNTAIVARVRRAVALSTGAACSSGIEAPSHVLRAMGLQSDRLDGALRLGIGKFNTDADIELAAAAINQAVAEAAPLLAP